MTTVQVLTHLRSWIHRCCLALLMMFWLKWRHSSSSGLPLTAFLSAYPVASICCIIRSRAERDRCLSNQTVNDGVAHSKNPRKCAYHVTFDQLTLTLTLSTPWLHADLESIVCKFGGDPAICLREEAICAKVYRRTDDGRRAIALAHSWNELKIHSETF